VQSKSVDESYQLKRLYNLEELWWTLRFQDLSRDFSALTKEPRARALRSLFLDDLREEPLSRREANR